MKNLPYILITVLILGLIGFLAFSPDKTTEPKMTEKNTETKKEKGASKTDTAVTNTQSTKIAQYKDYTAKNLAQATKEGNTLLFFHATWCPTCRAAEKDINNNISLLPKDLIILKTDYDTQTDLRTKYNLTSQHAFVLVDNEGNEISKWYGGGIKTILENLN